MKYDDEYNGGGGGGGGSDGGGDDGKRARVRSARGTMRGLR